MRKAACQSRFHFGCLLAGALALLAPDKASSATAPAISSIRPQSTNIVITVSVPAGFQRITLETRMRLNSGAWVPCAVSTTGPAAETITFVIPRSRNCELLRVRADTSSPLPAAFYQGTNAFWEPSNGSGGPVAFDDWDVSTPLNGGSRQVVESDIWKLDGNRLFVFNQYRGLQVIDIENPDSATLSGNLSLPGVGEQMYLVDSNHVALLVRSGCTAGSQDSAVKIVSLSNNVPRELVSVTVPGSIQESRMVGSALYVASQTCRPVPDTANSTWEWGTMVSAFDLAKPQAPVARGSLWFAGYGNVVAATDTLLFVVTQNTTNSWQSVVRIIDITSPDGSIAFYDSIYTAGRVADKFKLNYEGHVFTTISEARSLSNTLVTRLETFRVPDPRSAGPLGVAKLGSLELGNGEQLHATRFDGDRVYVVTFFRIDPLWIVDLSDPAQPRIAGAVDVPGWSTYIHPLGDRLLTIGVEANRVAVSLFSVENPGVPSLLSRVLLGHNYSWSEANNNEKAFTVLKDIGLALVPYSGDTTNGWTSRVQLIDLAENSLTARGIIQHQCQPRRAAFAHNRILSLSGWELLSVDANDRDQPVVRSKLDLAWSVERVFLAGDYLVELSGAADWWGHQDESSIRIAPAADPDHVLSKQSLGPWPITGAELKDGRLYLAQTPLNSWFVPNPASSNDPPPSANFVTTVLDLQNLPQIRMIGQTATWVDASPYTCGSWQAVWPAPDLLVWVQAAPSWFWGPWYPFLDAASPGLIYWPPYGYGGGHFLAFDIATADPTLLSRLSVSATNHFNLSNPLCVGPLVYLSHSTVESVPIPGSTNLTWRQRSWLNLVDYTDPASPTLRKQVNLPGRLLGVAAQGELLFTTGYHWSDDQTDRCKEWVDAVTYNGVEARLIDSLLLPANWPHPVLILQGTNTLVGCPAEITPTSTNENRIETWALSLDRKFVRTGLSTLPATPMRLIAKNGLLSVQATDNSLLLLDASNSASPQLVGYDDTKSCLGYNLDHADASLIRGLWLPLGIYGVAHVPVK